MSVGPYVYIGYRCNNNCIFCSEADEYLEGLRKKSLPEVKKEIIRVRNSHNFISFMGREPTLRKDIFEILRFANKLEFRQVGITTNGRMLSYDDFTRKILATGVNQIGISLSGAKAETHDKQTQVSGSFTQTIKGIKNAVNLKNQDTSVLINLPLHKGNYLELEEMIGLVQGIGVKEINILFIAPLSRRSRNKNIVMNMSELGHYVFNTVEHYLKSPDLKILLVEFLPCSLPQEAREYFFPCLEENPEKVRISLCEDCPYKDKCQGVLKSYIDLYGTDEFSI